MGLYDGYSPVIYAGVAQRQSSGIVNRRLQVRFLSPAPKEKPCKYCKSQYLCGFSWFLFSFRQFQTPSKNTEKVSQKLVRFYPCFLGVCVRTKNR